MKLREIEFGPCLDAPGVRGFLRECYWPHHLPFFKNWYNFEGSTRVAKTTTLNKRQPPFAGNMPLFGYERHFTPIERFPRCIWFSFIRSETLNAVGLTGPGAQELVDTGYLYNPGPFMISYMSVAGSPEERLEECEQFVTLLEKSGKLHRWQTGLQLNLSCPNTGLDTSHLVEEGVAMLNIAARLGIPLLVKLNLHAPIEAAKEIANHEACNGLCFTNALPFGSLKSIRWEKKFPDGSPLYNRNKQFGGGGYSGPEMLGMVIQYARSLRKAGVEKPFNVGGGIRSASNVDTLVSEGGLIRGHDSIFFASAAIVRPWNIHGIIRRAHELLGI
ncbi:hypothetical protein A3D70_01375 [Candidatus Adlerbacteria bacterium RIFCSPHIGHO2_02_FULL_54_18]|uniref:Uncharacterized protein n=1 Tax=Candidatus Adlerbacteria bacterium RIFCSPHIGHO2_02_FULL_54_18 TaxID=1797241 RepID=A0A1F4Y4M0_9BACT|nr:MAG: hypothetical protein A3D70_01375 [Candidatus Adlerbacteria bacterium RIFCSPHIGHO2_02_FULL_54_18]